MPLPVQKYDKMLNKKVATALVFLVKMVANSYIVGLL